MDYSPNAARARDAHGRYLRVDRPPPEPRIPVARVVPCCPTCGQTLTQRWLARLSNVAPRWGVWLAYGGRGRTMKLGDVLVRNARPDDVEEHLGTVPRMLIERLRDLAQDLRGAGW